MALAAIACGDARETADSTLAHDLVLAAQSNAAAPQLTDTALAPAPANATIARRTTPPPAPRDSAQQAPSRIAEPAEPPPAPAPVPTQPPFKGIAAGTEMFLKTKAAICTTNLPGDKLTATVAADVVGEHGAAIPAGTVAVLEVVEVIPGDTPENARVVLRIRSVLVNDQPVPVPSDVAITSELERRQVPRDKGSDRRKIVGGAVAGAIVGQIIGKDTKSTVTGAVVGAAGGAAVAAGSTKYDACLPAGGSLRVTTTQPVALTG